MGDDLPVLPATHPPHARGASGTHRHAEAAPPHWRRVQAYVCESGWPVVVALAGDLADPARMAAAEAAELSAAGVDIRADGTGHPCCDPADPRVAEWAARLDEAVARGSARIERAMQAAREPIRIEIEHRQAAHD
jgi:hypothetical protein